MGSGNVDDNKNVKNAGDNDEWIVWLPVWNWRDKMRNEVKDISKKSVVELEAEISEKVMNWRLRGSNFGEKKPWAILRSYTEFTQIKNMLCLDLLISVDRDSENKYFPLAWLEGYVKNTVRKIINEAGI